MNPKISFIIPVYNDGEYLEQCLDSVINQTLKDIEVICVDGGSTDNSLNILNKYQKKDSRIIIYSQENSGQENARNAALGIARGEYIFFVDSYDWIDLDASKELYELSKKDDLDVLLSQVINYDDGTNQFFETKYYNNAGFPKDFDEKIFSFDEIKEYIFFILCTPYSKLYKRSFLEKNHIIFPVGAFFEDNSFNCEVLLTSNRIKIFRKQYYFRRRRKDLVTAEADDTYWGAVEISNVVTDFFKKHDQYKRYIKLILNGKIEYLMYCLDVIEDKFKNDYIDLIFKDLSKIKANTTENNEFLNNLEGINKYFYCILDEKKDYHELYFLLSKYKFGDEVVKFPHISDINVAVIMDPLSYNCYSPEFNAFPLEPDNWLEIFENNKIDLLFCETTWDGVCEKSIENGISIENICSPWRGDKIIYCNRDKDHTISNIVNYCKKNNIPTIFWNRENPHAFDEFIDVALKFDYIFTTDVDSIIKYQVRGHNNVYQLLFASQLKLYNPIERRNRSNDIVFSGSWYPWFTQRCNTMHDLFGKIIDSNHGLKIYNRHSARVEKVPEWQFPEEYMQYVNPGVPSDKMAEVYKESKFALNINSITNSPTMFAMRVFELMSSNTFIFSNYSKGVYNLFGDNVIYLDKLNSLSLNYEDVDKICEENLYNVLENHTYYDRFKFILNTIKFPFSEKKKYLSVIYLINKNSNIEDMLLDFSSINYFYKKGFIVTDNLELNNNDFDNLKIISFDELVNLNDNWDDGDFFMFREMHADIKPDFVKKAFLHYRYLKLNYGILQHQEKYMLSTTREYKNIIFNSINFEKILNNILNIAPEELTVYSI